MTESHLQVASVHFDVSDDYLNSALDAISPQGAGQTALLEIQETSFYALSPSRSLVDTIALHRRREARDDEDLAPNATAIFFRVSDVMLSRMVEKIQTDVKEDLIELSFLPPASASSTTSGVVEGMSFRLHLVPKLLFVVQRHGSPLLGHIDAEGPKVAFLNTESESIEPVNSSRIDHIAIAVEQGTAFRISRVLQRLMAFHRFFCHGEDDNDLEAGLTVEQAETGMRMFTLLSSSDMAKDNMRGSQFGQRNHPSDFYFAIVEPKEGKKGQVYDFVHRHGANIQHVAFKTEDILADAAQIRAQGGLNLIRAGPAAAEHSLALTASFPDAFEQVVRLHQEGILVNARIQDGREKPEVALLSQIFTTPVHPQAELFFELIQRQNYRGFASANIGGSFKQRVRLCRCCMSMKCSHPCDLGPGWTKRHGTASTSTLSISNASPRMPWADSSSISRDLSMSSFPASCPSRSAFSLLYPSPLCQSWYRLKVPASTTSIWQPASKGTSRSPTTPIGARRR